MTTSRGHIHPVCRLAACVTALLLLAVACAPASAPVPNAGSAAAAAPPAASAPADFFQSAEWNALVEAARQEGKLVLSSVPNSGMRQTLPQVFRDKFGVELEFIGLDTPQAAERAMIEDAAGNLTMDLLSGGQETMVNTLHPAGMLAPIRPLLIHPDVRSPSVWLRGQPWFLDEAGMVLRMIDLVVPIGAVNADTVSPNEFRTAQDLLDPKWRGRMAGYDPLVGGPGSNTATYLMHLLGEDYVLKLYKGQEIQFSRDRRQLADWLARGQYPIVVALSISEVDRLRRDGFNVQFILPGDIPPPEGPASGLFVMMKNAPHPKAAQLFLNWITTREGMQLYSELEGAPGTRTDLDTSKLVAESVPQPGKQYFDTAEWSYVASQREGAFRRLRELLAR